VKRSSLSASRAPGLFALAAVATGFACQREGQPQSSARPARAAPGTGSISRAETTVPEAATPVAPSSSATATPASVLERLPPPSKPLNADCGDPRAVLTTRKEFDRSGRLFVQQVLLGFPELELVGEKATRANQIDVYETIYGYARFARLHPRDPLFSEAIIARCGDVATCNRVASLFEALQPKSKMVTLSCGVPPATTGGFARVAELAPERMRLPDDRAPRSAICARVAACSLREGGPLTDAGGCERASVKLGSCSAATDCAEVVRCAGALWK